MRQLVITPSMTDRSSAAVNRYFNELNQMEMISPEKETELAKRIHKGDQRALHQLVNANLRFVVSVAKQYQNYGLTLEDLIEEGNLGLIRAAQRFDETKGFKFISYAVWWIRQRIMSAIANNARLVRIPQNRNEQLLAVKKIKTNLEQELERPPTLDELSEAADVPKEIIQMILPYDYKAASVDAPVREDSQMTVGDMMVQEDGEGADEIVMHDSLLTDLRRAIDPLSEKEQKVLKLYFGIDQESPMSLYEIGREMNITSERVRQIRLRGIKKIRKSKLAEPLKAYLA